MENQMAGNHNSKYLPTSRGMDSTPTGASEVSKLIARCVSVYGERRGVDMRLMTAEWQNALEAYQPRRLADALSEHIRKSPYWPTIADLLNEVRAQTPPPSLPRFIDKAQDFAREGRTEAEEIIFRASRLLKMKQETGYAKAFVPDPTAEQRPASQDTTVSDMLANSPAAKRARGARV